MDVSTIELKTRQIAQRGIELPYRHERMGYDPEQNKLVVRSVDEGTVFISESTLGELVEQERYASEFGSVLLLGMFEGVALEQAGLAERETKGGYHRTAALQQLMERLSLI